MTHATSRYVNPKQTTTICKVSHWVFHLQQSLEMRMFQDCSLVGLPFAVGVFVDVDLELHLICDAVALRLFRRSRRVMPA